MSGRYKYRIDSGHIERLNAWWQPLMWPITEEEKLDNKWNLLKEKGE